MEDPQSSPWVSIPTRSNNDLDDLGVHPFWETSKYNTHGPTMPNDAQRCPTVPPSQHRSSLLGALRTSGAPLVRVEVNSKVGVSRTWRSASGWENLRVASFISGKYPKIFI